MAGQLFIDAAVKQGRATLLPIDSSEHNAIFQSLPA
jgi:1-deoxy-D-xylulose 5-phosphate reductoisomerase